MVYLSLRTAGLSVWLDEKDLGMDLQASMSEGIAKSGIVVALISPDYATSASCLYELRAAVAIGKPLITCCVEPGFWKTWVLANGERAIPDAHEVVGLARLATHLFVDLGNCARVQWASEATSAAERRALLQAPTAMPRLLKALAETRAALAAAEDAAAQRAQSRSLSLREKAQAALEAALAMWSAANVRVGEAEVLAERRVTEARRRAEAARLAHVDAMRLAAAEAESVGAAEADSGATLDRIVAAQAVLRAAKDEEKRVTDAEGARVAEARAARDACARARAGAASALASMRAEDA